MNNMSEIKLKTLAEVIALKEQKVDEASWGDARLASVDAKKVLEKNKFEISKVTANGFKVVHSETGCVGSVVFDPSLKESKDEIDEAMKIQDIIKLLSDVDSKLKAALKGFDEELYNSAAIENDIDEVQSKVLKIINKLKSGNYNK